MIQQSNRFDIYNNVINELKSKDLLYHCFATKNDIKNHPDISLGAYGIIYQNIRTNTNQQDIKKQLDAGTPYCMRLKATKALKMCCNQYFTDENHSTVVINSEVCGDVVIVREKT